MPRNANQSKSSNYSMDFDGTTRTQIGLGEVVGGPLLPGGKTYTSNVTVQNPKFSGSAFINFNTSSAYPTGNIVGVGQTGGASFWYLRKNASNNIEFTVRTDAGPPYYAAITGSTVLNAGQWYHAAFSWDGNTITLYLNGSVDGTGSATTFYNSSSTNSGWASIGSYWRGGISINTLFVGKITEVSIFDYALSSDQVTTLYGDSTNGVGNPMALPSPPIAYYPLGTSAWNGQYLSENNAIGDYVFDFIDGNNTFIDCRANENILDFSGNDYTVSAWVNWDGTGDANQMIASVKSGGSNVDFALTIEQNNGKISYWNGSTYVQSNSAIPTGVWCMVTIIVKATQKDFFINGVADGTPSQTRVATAASGTTFLIGKSNYGSEYFNGKISNLQVFNSVLSSTEIETLYNYGSPIKTLANIPQSSNLKAWYKLDASEVYNSTTTEWEVNEATSPWTSSLDFDGTDDYINVGTGNILTGVYSVSMWIKRTATSGGDSSQALFSKDNTSTQRSFNNYLDQSSGTLKMWQSANGSSLSVTQSSTAITDTNWHHVVYINPGSSANCQMYLDGTEVSYSSQNAGVSSIHTSAIDNMIGGHYIATSYQFYGSISNVSVWNTNLTSVQITEIYNNGTPSNLSSHSATSSLISWYKLNNTTTGIEDSKGSNNGTNNGATEVYGSVSTLNGESSGMSQANLVQSDLQTVAPYSKYALDFDSASSDAITLGNTIGNGFTQITCSIWANISTSGLTQSSYRNFLVKFPSGSGDATPFELRSNNGNRTDSYNNKLFFRINTNTGSYGFTDAGFEFTEANKWYHLVGTYDGSNVKLFVDGVEYYSISASGTLNSNNNNATIGKSGSTGNFNGKLSNASIWNTALTSAQVTELYNEGLPGNLNSHSAYSNLVSWWQLGENSSFDGNDWIVADEKGTNNGTSTGMPVGALVNGVGTTANGLSSGMSEGNLVGDAPYSTANAISTNMVVTSRVSGSGNTP